MFFSASTRMNWMSFKPSSSIPEAVGLLDPVWTHIRDRDQMPHIPRKKSFSALGSPPACLARAPREGRDRSKKMQRKRSDESNASCQISCRHQTDQKCIRRMRQPLSHPANDTSVAVRRRAMFRTRCSLAVRLRAPPGWGIRCCSSARCPPIPNPTALDERELEARQTKQ